MAVPFLKDIRRGQQWFAGFALTYNVDADLFTAWLAENQDSAMVKNRLIFAYDSSKTDAVRGTAKEGKDVDSGLGPLVPDVDRRMPKKTAVGSQTTALIQRVLRNP